MTYRRLVLQWARPAYEHYRVAKQNHNVSCILYKPQRLRNIKPNHQGTPKQPPCLVRGRFRRLFKNLPGKTATIPVPTDLPKLKISQISNLPKSSHIHHISEIFKSSVIYHSFHKNIQTFNSPLFQCFSQLSISAGKTRISH